MDQESKKRKRVRSTPYPRVNLKEAIEGARGVYKNLGDEPFSRKAAAEALGYKSVSGASNEKIAALTHYGLLRSISGSYIVTDLLKSIMYPKDEQESGEAVLRAAKRPTIFKYIFETYDGKPLPEMLDNNLFRNEKFSLSEKSSRAVVKIFKETAAFAGVLVNGVLKKQDEIVEGEEDVAKDEKLVQKESKNEAQAVGVQDADYSYEIFDGVTVKFPERYRKLILKGFFAKVVKDFEARIKNAGLANADEDAQD